MTQRLKHMIALLRWTLGLVVLYESCLLAFEPGRIRSFEHAGLPHVIRPILAGGEIAAAALYLVGFSEVAGSYLLLIVFAFAAVIHVLHDQYDVGGLFVYSMAVWLTLAQRETEKLRVQHE
jgi:uncharacterized membrane protein